MKMLKSAAVFVLALLSLCGCTKPVRVNQRAIVQGIGIDFDGNNYQLTLQIFEAKGGGAEPSISAGKNNSVVLQTEGDTIANAFEKASLKQGKQIFYGQNKMIVIGEDTAKQGLDIVINYFNTNHQSRPNVDVVMADGKAVDILSAELEQAPVPMISVKNMLDNTEVNAKILRGQVRHIVNAKENGHTGAYMPIIAKSKNNEKEESIEVLGTAVYSHNRLSGKLNQNETRGVMLLRNDVKGTSITVGNLQLGKISLEVVDTKTKIKPSIINGIPHFAIDCSVKSHIEESFVPQDGSQLLSHLNQIEQMQAEVIYGEMEGALSACLRNYSSDIFDFANLLKKYEPQWYQQNQNRYDELLPKFTYQINLKTKITRYGLQS